MLEEREGKCVRGAAQAILKSLGQDACSRRAQISFLSCFLRTAFFPRGLSDSSEALQPYASLQPVVALFSYAISSALVVLEGSL